MTKLDCITPAWSAPENITAITTTRIGGFSQPPYQSLNLGNDVGDDSRNVKDNRQHIIKTLRLRKQPAWLDQQHGSEVIRLTQTTLANPSADAGYTNEIDVVCAVLTADCLPVLFCDLQGRYVAAAHAGWRGLLHGVLENTLCALPASNEKIICWLGPAIGARKFVVGNEVVERFIERNAVHANAFQEISPTKYLANIYQLAKNVLTANNVNEIYSEECCTYSQKDRFFSYRRDGATGRMATLIWKNSKTA